MANVYDKSHNNGSIMKDFITHIVQEFDKLICYNTNRILKFQTQNYSILAKQITQINHKIQKLSKVCQNGREKLHNQANNLSEILDQEHIQKRKPINTQVDQNEKKQQEEDSYYAQISQRLLQSQSLRRDDSQSFVSERKNKLQTQNLQIDQQCLILEQLKDSNIFQQNNRKKEFKILSNHFLKMKFCPNTSQKLFSFPISTSEKLENFHQNFHQKFDEKINILFIISLKNGNIISAFSSLQFKKNIYPEDFKQQQFFIANLNKDIFIIPKEMNRGIKYDWTHMVFGNDQIKIKHRQNILITNFSQNGYYQYPQGWSIKDFQNQFLGYHVNGEVQIEEYQIYQLFQQHKNNQ